MPLDNRGRLIELVNIFQEHCSDKNGISMKQIIDRLENISGEAVDRKAVYRDIEVINQYTDMKITYNEKLKAYMVEKKTAFTKEEVEIITNALLTARFISKKDTRDIIGKLHRLTGFYRDKTITDIVRLDDRVKIRNDDVKIKQNISLIREAISKDRKIQFNYVKYNTKKSLVIEKQNCVVSPYEAVWYQDYYYMLGNYDGDRISHYRVDRMKEVKILEDRRKNISEIIGAGKQFNVAEYMSRLVGMSSGVEDVVVIMFKKNCIGDVIDCLGDKVSIQDNGPEYFTLRARVLINKKLV